jgi:deoxyribonuclease-4
MNDKRMDDIPLVLETIDDSIWDKEIELLYSFIE